MSQVWKFVLLHKICIVVCTYAVSDIEMVEIVLTEVGSNEFFCL